MKKYTSVFMILLTVGFALITLVIMADRAGHVIHLDRDISQRDHSALYININTATAEQLQLLPGISETLANDIISYRNDHGPFQSASDIQKVKGIGKVTFDRIHPYITVGGTS